MWWEALRTARVRVGGVWRGGKGGETLGESLRTVRVRVHVVPGVVGRVARCLRIEWVVLVWYVGRVDCEIWYGGKGKETLRTATHSGCGGEAWRDTEDCRVVSGVVGKVERTARVGGAWCGGETLRTTWVVPGVRRVERLPE